jgi:hypothetical protein
VAVLAWQARDCTHGSCGAPYVLLTIPTYPWLSYHQTKRKEPCDRLTSCFFICTLAALQSAGQATDMDV